MSIAAIWTAIQDHGWTAVLIAVVLSGLIEITPIQLSPWSKIARAFGKAINADVIKELADIKARQTCIKEHLKKHIQVDDERDASMHRQRILRFNMELIRGTVEHDHEYFTDMLHEIDEYEKYCHDHPDYSNNRAILAIANIRRTYDELQENHDF